MRWVLKMLKQRIITAIVLALTFIIVTILFSPFIFSLFIALIVLIAAWEWAGLIGLSRQSSKVSYLATLADNSFISLLGYLSGSQNDKQRPHFNIIRSGGLILGTSLAYAYWLSRKCCTVE